MSLFKRIRDVTLASVNDLIDKAEDPVKMLNQYLRDMEEDIAEAEISVAKQIAVEKRLKNQAEEARETVEKREEQAAMALESGNEDLARCALKDKKMQQAKVDDFQKQHENAKISADRLRVQLKEMKDEFDKMKNRKSSLVARAETAKAQKKINQTMSSYSKDSGRKGFDRMSDKVLQMESEADASKELLDQNQSLDDELSKLGTDDVEDELVALKERMKEKI